MTTCQRVFSPIQIANLQLSNRVIMPSMGTNLADSQGRVTPTMLDYYRARAQGGPGLLVVEAACVHPSGRVIERHYMVHDRESLEGLRALAQVVKTPETKAIVQIIHGGRHANPRLVGELLAPSALRSPTSKVTPRAMTGLEIEAIVECFARAAALVVEAGFDGVEIHGGHEYLVHQFLTPYCNQRQDSYGRDLAGRCRFACEVVRAVRRAMGSQPLISFRLSGDDHVRGGMGPEQVAGAAAILEDCGVNLFSVTGGVYETPHWVVPPLPSPAGTHVAAARIIKKAVKAPVAAAGRIRTVDQAEEFLADLDLVACGRAFLADPQWLAKSRQGRQGSIRPCVGCNQGCIDRVLAGQPITCLANPWLGREGQRQALAPAHPGIRVAVVGGGPAGLEAALTLGRLGHQVVLFEREEELGGQVRLTAVPPGKQEFARLIEFYAQALAELPNVELRLGREADVKAVCAAQPVAVVVATGSEPLLPALPGADQASIVTARQVLAGQAPVGRRVAVLGGGNLGSEVAHYLAERGHEVTIIELGLTIGADLGPARRYLLRRFLGEYGVKRKVGAMVRRLYSNRVSFIRLQPDGSRLSSDMGPVDTFVAALGAKPREALYLALEPKVEAIFLVGDALNPARMLEATAEGARAALEIHRLAAEGALNSDGKHC